MPDIDSLLSQMTLHEKCLLLSGETAWIIPGCERLGVSSWTVSDGPIGVRGRAFVPSLCLPSSSAWAATFDPGLVAELGQAIAVEAKDRAVQMVLGPTVNIHRDPRGGRHFECYSEDPYLSARTAVAYIKALQGAGVGSCIKHYVANDQEYERHSISADVPERAMREVYLAPFEAAVKEAGVWGVMAAYNDINGVQACEHRELLLEVLKQEWGFPGVVISDWWAVKDTGRAANGGLDVEMPGPGQFWGEGRLAATVERGDVPGTVIDDKARRVLAFLDWAGGIDATLPGEETSVDRPEHRALARRAAAASFVLLKNQDSLLPLDQATLRKVAVIGPNAEATTLLGGGSANVRPHHTTNILDSLREALGPGVEVVHVPGPQQARRVRDFSSDLLGGQPVKVEVFDNADLQGAPFLVAEVSRPLLNWTADTWPVPGRDLSVRATATFTPDEGGRWRFGVSGLGDVTLALDGVTVADSRKGYVNSNMEQRLAFGWRELAEGRPYKVLAEYRAERHHRQVAVVRFGAVPDPVSDYVAEAGKAAAEADVAIAVTGTNTELESEGGDRLTLDLPAEQDAMVQAALAANPRTIVVNNSGSPVAMPWASEAPAILQVWYPGQEGGDAVADVLLGKAEPGGRLPTTWAKRLEDGPAFTNYPGEAGHVLYGEGVFVGYRWFDARDIQPLWCFGHGLSYTTFEWGAPRLSASELADAPGMRLTVEIAVTNAGHRDGSEVVQCYVAPPRGPLARPPRELKGFAKLNLGPGQTATAQMELDRRAFATWDPAASDWVVAPGDYRIELGASSRDIRAAADVTIIP